MGDGRAGAARVIVAVERGGVGHGDPLLLRYYILV
jgi:hypothetical protein